MSKSKDKKSKDKFTWNPGDVTVIDKQDAINTKPSNNKKEALKKALEVLNHLVSDIGSDED
jgi:hypothetical protein